MYSGIPWTSVVTQLGQRVFEAVRVLVGITAYYVCSVHHLESTFTSF